MKLFHAKHAGVRRAFTTHDVLVWVLLVIVCAGVIVFALLLEGRRRAATPQVTAGRSLPTGTDRVVEPFALTNQDGEPFSTESLSGSYWLVNFIFTNCAGPCPTMTREMRELQKTYADENLAFVSISVDPKRDTPEKLKEFAQFYEADLSDWSFLSGEYQEIQRLAKDVFLLALANPAEPPPPGVEPELAHTGDIVHSSRFVLVGPDGKIVSWYNGIDVDAVNHLRATLDTIFERDGG